MWTLPDGRTKNQIDHVLIRRTFRSPIMDTRVRQGADVTSDHWVTKLKLKRTVKKKREKFKRHDLTALQEPDLKSQ